MTPSGKIVLKSIVGATGFTRIVNLELTIHSEKAGSTLSQDGPTLLFKDTGYVPAGSTTSATTSLVPAIAISEAWLAKGFELSGSLEYDWNEYAAVQELGFDVELLPVQPTACGFVYYADQIIQEHRLQAVNPVDLSVRQQTPSTASAPQVEYIYSGQYVDEPIAVFAETDSRRQGDEGFAILRDANYNVTAQGRP